MATGVTSKNGRSGGTEYALSWPGKRTASDIVDGGEPLDSPSQLLRTHGVDSDKNRIYWSENTTALRALLADPSIRGRVRLVYIDPPFATGQAFVCREQNHAYEDTLMGGAFLDFLYERLVLLRELLADDGSLYLHLDQTMIFEAKLVLDEVFGSGNFRNFITRKKCNRKNYTRKQYGNISDHILFYSKGSIWLWNRSYEPWNEERSTREYPCIDDDGRRYKKVPVHAPGTRNGATGQKWKGMDPPPGKHWQYTPARLDEMDAAGEIYWSPTGNPRRKIYLDQSPGIPVQDIWLDVKDPHNQNSKITGYPTEKEISLLERIVLASSAPGDLVLDAFMGSGTTLEAASTLGRRFIGIDASPLAVEATLGRLVVGRERMGDFVSRRNGTTAEGTKKPGQGDLFGEATTPLPNGGAGFSLYVGVVSEVAESMVSGWATKFELTGEVEGQ